jgi:hypothetical protein
MVVSFWDLDPYGNSGRVAEIEAVLQVEMKGFFDRIYKINRILKRVLSRRREARKGRQTNAASARSWHPCPAAVAAMRKLLVILTP